MGENEKNVPKRRFKEFENTGAWGKCKLGEITDRVVRKNSSNECSLPLTISAQYGLVDQITFFNNRVASRDVSNYYLVKKGEFAYNKSYSDGYPFGAIKRLERYNMGVLSTLYIVFGIKPEVINSDYLVSYYDTKNWHKQVAERAAEGARNHGLLNISADDFFDTEIKFPKGLSEQASIGAFFQRLDNIITLHQLKLDKMKALKEAYLMDMFPAEGERKPKLRFAGFTNDWEECIFSDYYKICSGYAFKYKDYTEDGVAIVNGESIQHGKVESTKFNYLPLSFKSEYANFILKEGDIVVGLNRPITDGQLKIARIPSHLNNSLLYQRAGKIKYINGVNADFSFVLLEKEILKHTLKEAVGSDQPFISTSKLEKWKMLLPKSGDEQYKIGSYFKRLDNLIVLHQRKLEKLQNIKKAYLNEMFI